MAEDEDADELERMMEEKFSETLERRDDEVAEAEAVKEEATEEEVVGEESKEGAPPASSAAVAAEGDVVEDV